MDEMACRFCNVNGTIDISEFLQQSGTCRLIIEAQWVVVTLIGAAFLLLLVLIESCMLICYGCLFCYKQRKLRRKYQLKVKTKKGKDGSDGVVVKELEEVCTEGEPSFKKISDAEGQQEGGQKSGPKETSLQQTTTSKQAESSEEKADTKKENAREGGDSGGLEPLEQLQTDKREEPVSSGGATTTHPPAETHTPSLDDVNILV